MMVIGFMCNYNFQMIILALQKDQTKIDAIVTEDEGWQGSMFIIFF